MLPRLSLKNCGDDRLELLETALDLVVQLCELLLGRLGGGPADAETLLLVWLGDHVDCRTKRPKDTMAGPESAY